MNISDINPEKKYHLVLVPDDNTPSVESFSDLSDLVVRLKQLICNPSAAVVRVYPFFGDRYYLTKGNMRSLIVPGQEPIPLFDKPAVQEMDENFTITVDEPYVDEDYKNLNKLLSDVYDKKDEENNKEKTEIQDININ